MTVVTQDALQSARCADLLKALSEPLRLRIVDLLRHGEMTVGDIAEALQSEVVTVSHHLGILKNAGFVEATRDGRYKVYRLREDMLQDSPSDEALQILNLGCCRIEIPSALNPPSAETPATKSPAE